MSALAGIALVLLFLWNTLLVYPLRVLVVFFHELAHAAAALATGGSVHLIHVNAFEGGLTITRGGNSLVMLSAGYIGSLLIGGGILVWSSRSHAPQRISRALGVVLLVATIWLVRPVVGFGFVFGLVTSGALLAFADALGRDGNAFVLKVIGMASCLYAVYDIWSDVLSRRDIVTDADLLANTTGIPAVAWGMLWMTIAVAGTVFFVREACRER